MAMRILLVLVVVALVLGITGWKWSAPQHRIAGWTWDDSANPVWVDD